MPFKLVQLGLFIPSIMHRYEVYLIAENLSTTLLREVQISNLSLVVTAISASSAREDTNYQTLEFLGDSILKMCTSVQLMAEYPLWHEGYLSAKKDRLIANSRLSRAAIETGLDKFIITKAFTGYKWRPLYVEDLLKSAGDSKRALSTKVLADVVEALIGAAMLDGGITKALACLQVFLPELNWQPLETRRSFLYQRVPRIELPPTLQPVESLIGYQFKKPGLLIEAMTHASYNTGSGSLERFEFLGDSVLDNIIVAAMYPHALSHVQMHLLRTALVNADFLAFICMEWSIEQEVVDLEGDPPQIKATSKSLPLWRFMRHMSPKIGYVEVTTLKRHTELREHVKTAIEIGTHYPWALLARLEAHKFYSDIIESLLGAVVSIKFSLFLFPCTQFYSSQGICYGPCSYSLINQICILIWSQWIDSGSLEICTQIVERMGILKYFRRILNDNVHVWHPKEELGMVADTESVRYVISLRKGNEMNKGKEYVCEVFVGDVLVVEMGGGVNKEEVKTKAAEAALQILKGNGKVLKKDIKMGRSVVAAEERNVDGEINRKEELEKGYSDVDMTIE
jgi:dsRNA-specific ribonuclease